jgi:hypothetical protein
MSIHHVVILTLFMVMPLPQLLAEKEAEEPPPNCVDEKALAEADRKAKEAAEEKAATQAAQQARAELRKYLFQKTGRRPSGNGNPKGYLLQWCNAQYRAVEKNPAALYQLVSEHLALADKKYLSSQEIEVRREGLNLGRLMFDMVFWRTLISPSMECWILSLAINNRELACDPLLKPALPCS